MIGIVLEQFRKIENSSRTLEHVFAGEQKYHETKYTSYFVSTLGNLKLLTGLILSIIIIFFLQL